MPPQELFSLFSFHTQAVERALNLARGELLGKRWLYYGKATIKKEDNLF